MKNQSIQSVAALAGAELLIPADSEGAADQPVHGISHDTRTLVSGDIYIPIIGARLDGHRFIEAAFNKGAAASFCQRDHLPEDTSHPLLLVDDTLEALHTLAANYRRSLPVQIIGITGSNGKTSTKDILYSILKQKFRTVKTIGNLNNEIGVPLTLLRLEEDTEIGVIEMGMSQFGEIAESVRLALPHISILTNVGDSHLEILKTRENVARAKLEILNEMGKDDLFFYNIDDPVLKKAVKERSILPRILSFGESEEANIRLRLLSSNASGSYFSVNGEDYHINLLGAYQMYNAGPAIYIARQLGMSPEEIQGGLKIQDPTGMRAEMMYCNGFDILMDAYKSNPQSLLEAMETAQLLSGYRKKIAILGDMLELGEREEDLHRDCGEKIDPAVFDYVLFYGDLARYMMEGAEKNFSPGQLYHFDSKPDLVDMAKYLITENTLVLVKGSRGLRMEEIVESIRGITAKDDVQKKEAPDDLLEGHK